jgi:hypothetical protein
MVVRSNQTHPSELALLCDAIRQILASALRGYEVTHRLEARGRGNLFAGGKPEPVQVDATSK